MKSLVQEPEVDENTVIPFDCLFEIEKYIPDGKTYNP